MTHWDDIRAAARRQRAALFDGTQVGGDVPSAESLLTLADDVTGFERVPVHAGDSLLYGGEAMLDLEWDAIRFNVDVPPPIARFNQAHEYAHLWLHRDTINCRAADLDAEASEEVLPLGVQRVDGYGPLERREREANIFARELLLPTDALRGWYAHDLLTAAQIASQVGVVESMVVQQLARALLTPEVVCADRGLVPLQSFGYALDPSQQRAAHVSVGPLLVRAGPGTGKTRTLVGRILFLLERGAPPDEILALTFSNRAAEEMRQRVAQVAPDAAPRIWMGTFHAFGLELLRKYGTRLGLPTRPAVLDPVEAVGVLESCLSELQLDYYQNLYEPTLYLRDMLAAISRAKDELASPADYLRLAETMRAAAASLADDEQARVAAEKALEVARVYAIYAEKLDSARLIDFGDLINKPIELLRSHPDVRDEVRRMYPHVLVDEYQDVNRASALFLHELAGTGEGLWVVGDERQAIYRFRGAAPANMHLFPTDFPLASVVHLERNYRSQPAVLDVFSDLAPRVHAAGGQKFVPWTPVRAAEGGEILMEIADDQDAEGAGIAREIQRQRTRGIAFRDQAVLCRSHTGLARIATALENAGVPVLYLGDLFERPEIRDMLSLVALATEPDGRGLVRVARFPEYQIPLSDVLTLLRAASEQSVPFPSALRLIDSVEGLTANGSRSLLLLRAHLDGLTYGTHPWRLLTQYLFVRSQYLRSDLSDRTVAGQQRRLALFQFLQFVHELPAQDPTGDHVDPKRRLLRTVRRLEVFGEEKQLRQVPAWAESIDAVRLMTVHASKGLEFRAVYLPGLGRGYFPSKKVWQPCPPPIGLITGSPDDHMEEEECLFFVALSRARDVLCLSRARRYGKQNNSAGELVLQLAEALPRPPDGEVTWPSSAPGPVAPGADVSPHRLSDPSSRSVADPPRHPVPFKERDLSVYMRCPRQYYYEFELGLSGRRDDSAYVQFHQCVYRVLRWLRSRSSAVSVSDAVAQLDSEWSTRGPKDHPYAAVYYASAREMVERWAGRPTRARSLLPEADWEVQLPHGRVSFTPDNVEDLDSGGLLVERLRTGRPTKTELDDEIYALYTAAPAPTAAPPPADLTPTTAPPPTTALPPATVPSLVTDASPDDPSPSRMVQVRYLATDQVEPVTLKPRAISTRLAKYDAAIVGILNQDFAPEPNDRICPRCPHYFICPAAEQE